MGLASVFAARLKPSVHSMSCGMDRALEGLPAEHIGVNEKEGAHSLGSRSEALEGADRRSV
jgi:hypothetical protein